MEAGAFLHGPASTFVFWWLVFVLFHLLDYIYCRIILHQLSHVRGFLSASPWVFILVVGFFRLLGTWDFRWESWGRLDLFLRVWVGGVTAFSLALLGRQVVWFFWGRRKVTYRLTRHEKVRAPFHPPMRFLEKFGIRNQLYDLSFLEYDLELPGWPIEWSGLSIAHISDVHHGKYVHDAYLAYVHRAVTAWHTDLIIFTGDFVGGKEDIPHAFEWLKGLKAEMGVWAVLGNHDGWSDPIKAAKGLKAAGIGLLANQAVFFHRSGSTLALMGADDLWTGGKDASALEHAASKADARILLAHQPDHFSLARKLKAHLQLSGHCHGGQICLPGGIPLVAPSRFGVRYAGGFYREDSSVMFASRGIGAEPPLRTFCPPEVVKLRLLSPGIIKPNKNL